MTPARFLPFSRGRTLQAVLFASLLCGVLATSVYVGFVPVRAKLVRTPTTPVAGHVDTTIANSVIAAPAVVIARIHNRSGTTLRATVHVDGLAACSVGIQAESTRRLDCALSDWRAGHAHEVSIRAPGDAWMLDYLEIANLHGASRGALSFVILPSTSSAFERPSPWWTAAAWLLLAGLFVLPVSGRLPGAVITAWRIGAAVTIAIFTVALVARFVSPYAVVLSSGTFLLGTLVLSAPRAWRVYRAIGERPGSQRASLARAVLVSAVVLVAFGSVAADRLAWFGGNYSGFVQISRAAYDRVPFLAGRSDIRRTLILLDNRGYDGEFMYFAAFDPLLRLYRNEPRRYDEVMDTAPYRYGRIAFSALTRALAVGRWEAFPAVMLWIVLASTFLSALFLSLLARERGASAAWGGLVLLIPGFWRSLQMALPESLAAAALLCGVLLLWRGRYLGAGLAFAVSLLTRETGLALVVCAIAATAWNGRRRDALLLAFAALVPPIAWHLHVGSVLSPTWGARAYFFNPQIVGLPLGGVVRMWSEMAAGHDATGLAGAAVSFPFLLAAGFALAAVLAVRHPDPVTVAAAAYGALSLSLNYANVWSHAWNAVRASYELFLLLALVTTGSGQLPRWLRYFLAAFWVASAAYVALYGW